MATTGPPFDKPMTELREAFVRARFGQADVFGRPDIEEWLTGQREAERPEDKTWVHFLGRRTVQPWADRDFFDLRSHATSLGVLNERFRSVGEADAYGPIYDCLAFVPRGLDPKRGLYSGDAGMLYVEDHIHGPMFVVREEWGKDGGVTITRVRDRSKNPGARTILGVVLTEWQCGRSRWQEARASLCCAFDDAITHERAKAEADFDSAVAVSANGTKIVHADWVVVVPASLPHPRSESWVPRSRMTVFPGTAFRALKILKSNERMRLEPHYDPWSHRIASAEDAGRAAAEQFAIVMRSPEPSQAFGYLDKGVGAKGCQDSCLITTANFCPSPLPDGGVEVTV